MNEFPRVTLPGSDPEEISFVRTLLGEAEAQERHVRRQQRGMARAMVALGKPIFRAGTPKRRKVTKHVRHMRAMKARTSAA